jgi:cardiolipin synthase A/B
MNKPNWHKYFLKPDNVYKKNEVRLLTDGGEAFPDILGEIDKAQNFVLIEVYSIVDDVTGRKFQTALIEKAKKGVKVFFVYDAVGCMGVNKAFFNLMTNAGVNVAQYHPLVPWKPHWSWFRRNHRKLIIVDNRMGFVGGMNLTDEYAPPQWGGANWRDTAVKFRGPALKEAIGLFWKSWKKCGKEIPKIPDLKQNLSYTDEESKAKIAITFRPGIATVKSIRRAYYKAISKAEKSIYITNSYFLPGWFIARVLIKSAKKGLDVKIITPYQTDHAYVRWASWTLFKRLIKAGVKVYEWQPTVLHAKTAVVDDVWSCIGSHNLDHRSLHYNLEINLCIHDRDFGKTMAETFERDLQNSRQVTMEDLKRRTFLFKLASRMLYWLRIFL